MKMLKSNSLVIAAIVSLLVLGNFSANASENGNPKDGKYYQVVLIWVKDPAKFQEYGEKMGPIVSKYGGAGERIITPVSSFFGGSKAKDMESPHMVNIVYYDSKESYEQFEKDPEFKKIVHLRDESIEMAGIGGFVEGGDLVINDVANRLYMIEFAYYSDEKGKSFKKYEKEAKSYYEKYRLRNERILTPDNVFGGFEMPDKVSIKYIENKDDKPLMEQDGDHGRIEQLYGEAIRDLVWIEGQAAYVNMK